MNIYITLGVKNEVLLTAWKGDLFEKLVVAKLFAKFHGVQKSLPVDPISGSQCHETSNNKCDWRSRDDEYEDYIFLGYGAV
jgi:hypothetical protein